MTRTVTALIATLSATAALATQAQTTATAPWVRASVAGQQATGLFVDLKSPTAARLVGGSSPVAASVEVHEMRMDNGVMRMRALPALALPAGQSVSLKPGGHHVMLMGLRQPVKAGDTVPVTLTVARDGAPLETLTLHATARQHGPAH